MDAQVDREVSMDRIQELERAFASFSSASKELETSYAALETRVGTLTEALGTARQERHCQRRDNARLARRLQLLMEALPGAVLLLDASGVVQQANPGAAELFGDGLEGQDWGAISERCVRTMNRSGEFVTYGGRRLSLARRSLRPESGQILLFTDVTEERAVEDLMERHDRLSTMGEMAASLAHQIRTPLSSALLYASSACAPKIGDGTRRVLAERVVARLHDLDRLVKDMLHFARGGAPADIGVRVEDLFSGVRSLLQNQLERGQRLLLDAGEVEMQIPGNEQAVVGALLNLANNALEAAGTEAEVSIQALSRSPGSVDMLVSDNGPGVVVGQEEKIFDPFYTTRPNGTGLGLSVVRSVARFHKGDAWLERRADGGATFVMRLPILEAGPIGQQVGLGTDIPEVAA